VGVDAPRWKTSNARTVVLHFDEPAKENYYDFCFSLQAPVSGSNRYIQQNRVKSRS